MTSRGRMAIPGLRGISMRQFLARLWRALNDHASTDLAAELSFYAMFSLFPLLFVVVTLTAWLPLSGALDELMARMARLMPSDALGVVERQIASLLSDQRPKLLTAGLAVMIWSASRAMDALRRALNLAYDVRESRSFWRTQGMALVLTVAVSVLVLASVSMIVLGGDAGMWLATRAHVAVEFQRVWSWLRWPVTALVFMLAAAVSYYALPDVQQQFRYITPGSVTSTILWLVSTWGFTQYVEHFGNYNVMYGSIGGVVVLMTWLYISALVLIVGGEMNAVIEHASVGGKTAGARAPGEPAPPASQRPSAMPPGVVKSADVRPRGGPAADRPVQR